jgi:hypothetical protein
LITSIKQIFSIDLGSTIGKHLVGLVYIQFGGRCFL